MRIVEFRILLPFNCEKYNIGNRYMNYLYYKDEKGGGEGIELVKNEESYDENNQFKRYTYKIYHIKSRIPRWIRWAIPDKYLHFHEESNSDFYHSKTRDFVPGMEEYFMLQVESKYFPYKLNEEINDNVMELTEEELQMRSIVYLDVLNGKPDPEKEEYDCHNLVCPEIGINEKLDSDYTNFDGKDIPPWAKTFKGELMMGVKVVKFMFKWRGLQTAVEKTVMESFYPGLFTNVNRKVLASSPIWAKMTLKDIKDLEDKIQKEQYDDGGFICDDESNKPIK